MINQSLFANRRDAGRRLARSLRELSLDDPVVLALPRGGVPVGFEVAKALGAPLDVLLVRKIGAPGHPEYGIGAVVDGAARQVVIDLEAARLVGAGRDYIDHETERQLAEIERRRSLYQCAPPVSLAGRTVILVDDGIATGGTVRAALKALSRTSAKQVVLAVPLAPADLVPALTKLCDQVVCLATPSPFHAVGLHYGDFSQTEDEEVIRLLGAARQMEHSATAGHPAP